jgi:hypothetical protein
MEGVSGGNLRSAVYMEGPRVPSIVANEAAEKEAEGNVRVNTNALTAAAAERVVRWDALLDREEDVQEALIPSLCEDLHKICLENLEHKEPRVRTLVAKAVGAYVRVEGCDPVFATELHGRLFASIRQHLEAGRDEVPDKASSEDVAGTMTPPAEGSVGVRLSRASTGALDDTTGWRALETNWQCLASLVHAMESTYFAVFDPFDDQLVEDCRHSAVVHVNRHVRAAAMNVLEQWVRAASRVPGMLLDPRNLFRTTTVAVLKTGLADNWSQVRMAASVLCRVFLIALQAQYQELEAAPEGDAVSPLRVRTLEDDMKLYGDIYPILLPRMCLNRYYMAQGVKLYSYETWLLTVQDRGVDLVAAHLPAVVRYYCQMCDADNHVVREAACQAISELAVRLGGKDGKYPKALAAHAEVLLQALLMCFHDESWPVRDEACMATAILCKSYPEECRSELKLLWNRWVEQLTDQIWSVRQDAAVALGDAVEAYPELWPDVLELLRKILPSAREQPAMTKEAYKAHQNDIEAHTGAQLYSCGSLAPKLQKKAGAGRIGCSSCGIDRPKAPWEATDGSIYLLRELTLRGTAERTETVMTDEILLPLLRELADVCRIQHFPQSDDMRTTLWRQLPTIAHALGKERFKRHYLDIFTDLMFHNLESRSASQVSIHAAGQCAEEIAELVGRAIFRGRLEDYQRDVFDQVMRDRALMPKGPDEDAGFSPFGPPGLLDAVNKKFAAAVRGH